MPPFNTDDSTIDVQSPKILKTAVVQKGTSDAVVDLMKQYVDVSFPEVRRDGFILGGKTGTAQVPKTDGSGGYRDDVYNATFAGYIGREKPKYVVIIRLDEGSASSGFSGFNSAKPVFVGIANGIMDNVPISND